jgi:hypothetical protein
LECIRDPGKTTDKKVKRQVLKYTSLDDDLYRRTIDDMLLNCLGEEQAKVAVQEVHDGICGAHQSAYKVNWLLWRAGFYWPTMTDDCVKYQKGCEACQRFGNVQLAPADVMNSIVNSSPFRGWAEPVPLRNMTHLVVINFVEEQIFYRFGVPQTLTTNQGPSFMSLKLREFAESMKIKLLNSSPYYAQANGQA